MFYLSEYPAGLFLRIFYRTFFRHTIEPTRPERLWSFGSRWSVSLWIPIWKVRSLCFGIERFYFLRYLRNRSGMKSSPKKAIFEYLKNIWRWLFHQRPVGKKYGFLDPPKRVLVVWSNHWGWEESKQVPPSPQCWITRVMNMWSTRVD